MKNIKKKNYNENSRGELTQKRLRKANEKTVNLRENSEGRLRRHGEILLGNQIEPAVILMPGICLAISA